MSLEIRNAPGQPGYALLVFSRDLDVGSLKLAIQNRMSRKYLGPSVGKANWSPARSHFFDAIWVSCSDGETVFKIGPEAASFIPDETSVEFTSEDNTISEHAIWSGILPPFFSPASDSNPENVAEIQREDLKGPGREHNSLDAGAEREIGIEPSRSGLSVPAPEPAAEQALSRPPSQVETSDEKLDQLIAAFAGELETEAAIDRAESETQSFRPAEVGAETEAHAPVGAETDAHGLVDETMHIAQGLSDASARRTKSATDWLLLFTTLGFLYLGVKLDSANGNGGPFFIFVAAVCGVWWISRLKVGSSNR